ncbi:unnamed protein product [Didymodactylos carnosus]|uniref:Uncharacterized protein n=1 Tax=Didymodactylos carnosus TaxID=1234261 RepID=A0A814HGL3_9BILA|nr:unnamed protein product [Didymodactylos carnosus]CAF1009187.1 unnamed protein product [Didymodactylos carnosus]CAF3511521.1 unnamed protein product [Didymodactylos carnosus]CAF3780280.1 unnamed protein product [Didymodactylos carnosus]
MFIHSFQQNIAPRARVFKGYLGSAGAQVMAKFPFDIHPSKIWSVVAMVEHMDNRFIHTGHTAAPGYLFDWYIHPEQWRIQHYSLMRTVVTSDNSRFIPQIIEAIYGLKSRSIVLLLADRSEMNAITTITNYRLVQLKINKNMLDWSTVYTDSLVCDGKCTLGSGQKFIYLINQDLSFRKYDYKTLYSPDHSEQFHFRDSSMNITTFANSRIFEIVIDETINLMWILSGSKRTRLFACHLKNLECKEALIGKDQSNFIRLEIDWPHKVLYTYDSTLNEIWAIKYKHPSMLFEQVPSRQTDQNFEYNKLFLLSCLTFEQLMVIILNDKQMCRTIEQNRTLCQKYHLESSNTTSIHTIRSISNSVHLLRCQHNGF